MSRFWNVISAFYLPSFFNFYLIMATLRVAAGLKITFTCTPHVHDDIQKIFKYAI